MDNLCRVLLVAAMIILLCGCLIIAMMYITCPAYAENVSVYNYNTGQYEYIDIEPNDTGISVYNFTRDEFSDAERVDIDKHQGYDYNSGTFKEYTDKGNGEVETYDYSTGQYETLEVIK